MTGDQQRAGVVTSYNRQARPGDRDDSALLLPSMATITWSLAETSGVECNGPISAMSIYHCGLMMLLAIGRSPPSDHAGSPAPTKVQSRPMPMSRLPPTAALPCRSGTMHISLVRYVATKYDCMLFTLPSRPIHSAFACTSILSLFISKQYAPRILPLPHADVTQSDTSNTPDGVLIGRPQALPTINNWLLVSISTAKSVTVDLT